MAKNNLIRNPIQQPDSWRPCWRQLYLYLSVGVRRATFSLLMRLYEHSVHAFLRGILGRPQCLDEVGVITCEPQTFWGVSFRFNRVIACLNQQVAPSTGCLHHRPQKRHGLTPSSKHASVRGTFYCHLFELKVQCVIPASRGPTVTTLKTTDSWMRRWSGMESWDFFSLDWPDKNLFDMTEVKICSDEVMLLGFIHISRHEMGASQIWS